MASPNQDLIDQFGGGKSSAKPMVSPNADLINEFGGGTVQAIPAGPEPKVTYEPDGRPNPPKFISDSTAAPSPKSTLDKQYTNAVVDEYTASKNQFSKGFEEIGGGLSATGVGNVALGGLGMAMAPVTPVVKGLAELGDKALPGNPQGKDAGTGEKALMILPVKGGGNFVKSRLPSNMAVEALISSIGKENIPEVIRRMKANERISPIDVSNSALQVAQKLAVTEGEHQQRLNKFSEGRVGGSNEAVKAAFDDNLGVPVNALEKIEKLKANAKETGAKFITPVVEKAGAADITPIIKNLEESFGKDPVAAQTLKQLKAGQPIVGPGMSPYQQRLFELRQDLRGDWADRDKMLLDVKGEQGLHEKQIALRREAQDLLDSPDAANRRLGNRLMDIRNKYVDAIDKVAPGYKEGLSKYADDMQIQEAFERGFSLFGKSPKITNRPEFLIEELKREKRPEIINALKEGGRIAVDSMTRQFKNSARKGEDLVASDFNAEKIKALYGEKEANKLISTLEDERAISTTDSKLFQNSQTAMRLKADSRVQQAKDPNDFKINQLLPYAAEAASLYATSGAAPGLGASAYLAAKGVNKYGITPTINKYRGKQNDELTKLMTATGEEREMLIKILEDRIMPPKGTIQQLKHFALPVLPP